MDETQPRRAAARILAMLAWLAPFAITASRAEAQLYDVELIVFQNLVQNDAGEVWPRDYSDWSEDGDPASADAAGQDVNWLGKPYRLGAHYEALRRSAQYRPLAHFAWRQAVFDRKRAVALQLPASATPAGGAYVDGSVRVAVERYLHLYLDLQLHDSPAPELRPDRETQSTDTAVAESQPDLEAQSHTAPLPGFRAGPEAQSPATPEFRLRENRRMRSKELHYFDNPRFGALALITPHTPAAPDNVKPDKQATSPGSQP